MKKRFKKLQFLCKKKQEYRGLNFQEMSIVFGRTRKFRKFSSGILQGRTAKTIG